MTKHQMDRNVAGNNFADKAAMGFSIAVLVGLAYKEVFDHVQATEPMAYALAGAPILVLLFLILSPIFRK